MKSQSGGGGMDINWEAVGTGIGAFGVVMTTVWGVMRGQKKSDGKPPEDRPPTPNELRAAIAEFRETLQKIGRGQDDMADDYEREFREINRQLDRIENRVSVGVQHFTDRTIPPGRG